MVTVIWVAEDGTRFDSIHEALQHHKRVELKALLLGAPLRDEAANKEAMNIDFVERLTEWMLSEPTRATILEVLQLTGQDFPQPDISRLNRRLERLAKRYGQRVGCTPSDVARADMVGDATRDFPTTKE